MVVAVVKQFLLYIMRLLRSCVAGVPFIGSTINNWMGYRPLRDTSLDADFDDDDDNDAGHRSNNNIRLRVRSRNEAEQFVSRFNSAYGSIHPRFFVGHDDDDDDDDDESGGGGDRQQTTSESSSSSSLRTPTSTTGLLDTSRVRARRTRTDSSNASRAAESVFKQLVQKAKAEYRILLVYLHSDHHENTPEFCERVVCTESFRDYVDENFLFFGADVLSQEGMLLSHRLEASTYPFMAVMIAVGTKLEVAARIEGPMSLDALISRLIDVHERVMPTLIIQRNEDEQRMQERLMIEEQDRAYAATVERDRQMMEQRQREEMEARRAVQEAEKFKRDFAEKLDSLTRERKSMRNELPVEAARENKDSSLIRFRFPNGAQMERRFLKSDSIKWLYQFVHSLDQQSDPWSPRPFSTLDKYTLSTNFPKRDLDMSETLESAKCHPHAIVFVHEDIDEADEQALQEVEFEQQH